ncbi:MAG: hypothetical protein AMXMBFR13_47930 [Phycisphaerae bacterium]
MPLTLTAVQRRVLGVLIEKSMTTPGSYPMTLNAIVTGCNQLTCRDPVMQVTEGDVAKAVYDLQQMRMVKQADPDRTSRVNRFKHNVEERFGWDNRQRAIMAELFLRGPQTAGELKTNASRMTPITELSFVNELLSTFEAQDPPLVRELPRQPGKNAVRFDHCYYPEDEAPAHAAASTAAPATPPAGAAPPPPVAPAGSHLEARIERLEGELVALREELADLKTQLGLPESGSSQRSA